MLPDIRLDEEGFEEILEKARNMLPKLSPQWTDFNDHDPGITLLELMVWMIEMQQYHMDQIGERHLRKYWKLLGIIPEERKSAKVLVTVRGREEGYLPRGSRFYADQVCFETENQEYLCRTELLEGICEGNDGERRFSLALMGEELRIPLFGKNPRGGESFCISLSAPLLEGVEYSLYLKLYDGYSVKRNPVRAGDSFEPLARLKAEAFTHNGFQEALIKEDETFGLLFSGSLRLVVQGAMKEKEGRYWLRLQLEEAGYDTVPELTGLSLQTFPLSQHHTCSLLLRPSFKEGRLILEHYLAQAGEIEVYEALPQGYRRYEGLVEIRRNARGAKLCLPWKEGRQEGMVICLDPEFADLREVGEGTGFPFQEFELKLPRICKEGLSILAETEKGSGYYREWTQVRDFDSSGPEDLHYVLENGILRFGDCYRGCGPEGRIFIGACRTSMGALGNIKAGSIERWEPKERIEAASNKEPAFGGAMEESLEDLRKRAGEKPKQKERAVAYEDYEELVRRTPGLRVRAVKAISLADLDNRAGTEEETQVGLAVAPFSEEEQKQPSRAYLRNILRMLEPRRMIGTGIRILPARYIGVSVFVEAAAERHYEQVRGEIGEVLKEYFEKQGWDFGQPLSSSELYGRLDTLSGVKEIRRLTLDAKGKGVRINENGDVLLPPNGLCCLKDWECAISQWEASGA